MIKLIAFLISGCWYKWTTEKIVSLHCKETGAQGTRVYLKCERCGDWKNRDML